MAASKLCGNRSRVSPGTAMSSATPRIVVDPFFDAPRGGDAPIMSRMDQTPTSGYISAEREYLDGGRTVAQTIGSGPAGLRATIIPKATMGGVPAGTNPHRMNNVEVTIDPHIPQQSSRVRLGDITEASLAAANASAQEYTPEPHSLETMRLRGSAVMHGIAAQRTGGQRSSQPALPPPMPSQQQNIPMQPQRPTRRVSPLSAFHQAPAPVENREQRVITLPPERVQERVLPSAAASPTIRVVFENEHMGEYEAYYHDVVIEEGFVVLIYDTRWAGPKHFPATSRAEKQPILAMNLIGTTEVYQVQTTGVHYQHGHNEHCVLMVDEVGKLPSA